MSERLKHRLHPEGPALTVELIQSPRRSRTLALQVTSDARVVVRTPVDTRREKIVEFLRIKNSWLERKLIDSWGMVPRPVEREFVAGESFRVLGRQFRLALRAGGSSESVVREGEYLVVTTRGGRRMGKRRLRTCLISWFTEQAEEVIGRRIDRWAARLGVKHAPPFAISDQSLRWGSCGRDGTLRFNWRMVGAPVSLVDYVVAHELCHLMHHNHSHDFWRELGRAMPDWKEREQKLAQLGPLLSF